MESFKVGGGLLESTFVHKQNLNSFFTEKEFKPFRNTNSLIYTELLYEQSEEGLEIAVMEPLVFFNTLYDQVNILRRHYQDTFRVIEHLHNLELSKEQLYLVLKSLVALNCGFYLPGPEEYIVAASFCIDMIYKECAKLYKTLHNEIPGTNFIYDLLEPLLETFKEPDGKIRFLMNRINVCKHALAGERCDVVNAKTFIKRCEIQIEYIKELQANGYFANVPKKPNTSFIPDLISKLRANKATQVGERLQYDYSKEQVLNYFMQLSRYYTKEQVMHFLKANFEGFAEPGEKVERVKLPKHEDLDKQHIMYMVYRFWRMQKKRKFGKKKAAILLESNFSCFESFDIVSTDPVEKRTVYSNMRKEPKKEYPFSSVMLG